MGNNNLSKVEKNLRSIAKRYKTVKYSLGLAILFLMMGVSAFSEETVQEVPTSEEIALSRKNLKNSVGDLQSKIDDARKENEKELKGLKLELIQLVEQGDQVIKSKWSSWQFGTGYTYNEWSGKYKGLGDKEEKYIYQGIYTRGNWKVRNAMDIEGAHTGDRPITPGHENTSNWTNTNRSTTTVETVQKDKSINSGVNGNREWGLVKLRNLKEPTNEVEILAKISPKDVFKEKLDIDVTVQTPDQIVAPVVKPNVNKPTEAPKVKLPKASSPQIPGEPTLSPNPTINVMKVTPVGTITVNPNPVAPVNFFIPTGGAVHQTYYKSDYNKSDYDNKTTTLGGYLNFWGIPSGSTTLTNASLNVVNANTRAIVVDEGRATAGDTFTYKGGTIRLNENKNAGIDVQGTHMGSYSSIYQMTVINQGNIVGVGGKGKTEHAAFAFNNFDSSSDSTRVRLINDSAGGNIELNTPISAGMMLRPEITEADNNYQGGLNMQMAENSGNITLNGRGSVGVTVVKNTSTTPHLANNGFLKTSTHVIIPVGQLLASRSDEANKSGILNTGKIYVQGDDSSGVAILNMIQDVRVNGEVNVGTVDPSTLSGPNGANPGDANKSGGTANKVEGSVGVYTEVATRPVRARVYTYDAKTKTETITERYYDDHGRENTIETELRETYEDANGVTQHRHRGETVGTETVEVGGTITLGPYAENSFGLRNNTSKITTLETKDNGKTHTSKTYTTSGSITLVSGGKVIVQGAKNFGAVSAGDTYEREVKKGSADYPIRVTEVGKIDINSGAEITVTGEQSIGYAMLSGAGTNAGTITVTGQTGNTASSSSYNGSLGFYGQKGKFTNTGSIETSGKLAHAVVLKQASTTPEEMTFNHYGTISVSSPAAPNSGNMGVYSDGYALANFYNGSKVYVGDNSVGIHTSKINGFNDTFKNLGTLDIKIGSKSTFAYLDGNATTTLKEFFNLGNVKVNIEAAMGTESSLVYANNEAKAHLDADYTITQGAANSTIALLAANKSEVKLTTGKKLTTDTQVALAGVDGTTTAGSGSTAINEGAIVSTRTQGAIGIYTKDKGSKGFNKDSITMQGKEAVGIYGKDVTTLENTNANSTIKLQDEQSIGMYGEVSAINTATPFTVKNNGIIELTKDSSVGIFLKNASTKATDPQGDLIAENNKEIKITGGTESIGIYAPASKVSKVGKITMANGVTKSIATYISKGTTIADTASADINLGTSGTNIAYYVKNKDTSLGTSANLGKVTGYGIGVYLTGTSSTDKAVLAANAPEFNFTTGGATGDGIIGLYVKGDTDISAYTKTITVGDRKGTETNPINATGIYVEAQGTSTTPYEIKAKIAAGENSVGIFSHPGTNKSYIKYLGTQMDLRKGATAFYVNGKTELDTSAATTTINLAGGLVAYVTEGSEFVAGKTTVNLSGKAIGVYGEKGAKVDVGSWTFNNYGYAAEEVRLKEGQAKVTTPKNLKPRMVLTHVINGETYINAGTTVTSVADPLAPSVPQEENIGLMAEGLKNPTAPSGITGGWNDANFEIVNSGTINFSSSKKSTAIFAESARAKNDGVIKLGESSTGIYGIYKDGTDKYAPAAVNKLEIETTANSDISLGKNSTGMYLINAQKLTNAAGGKIESATGATNNVGIYAINGEVDVPTTGTTDEIKEANDYNGNTANFKILTMDNKANITLGNGSVGIYTRGKGTAIADRNIVKNDGNITVGDKITVSKTENYPAVGIYAENTQLTQGNAGTANITVGNKGLAFYGKNSEITAKGTVNYTNQGTLAYLEDSEFTSHYGNLTAHQNTMLFLKNSKAYMDGAGTKIDITVPDKAATSGIFAGVYVERTSQLNGVKKIEVGENSNGIFMKDAIFTSSAEDIVATKEGAKGLLAIDSNLINDSKITLSGDKSIGIYSNANNTKTVTNNGKLDIAGKQTLGVFLKGAQTFVNTADINIADTTSSDPNEKTIGIYTKDGTSTIKHNSGNIEVGEKSIGIFSTTNSGVEMNGGKIHVKDEAIGFYKENGTLLLKGQIDIAPHVATAKNSEPVGVYAINGANVTDSASNINVGAKSYGFIFDNDSALTNGYTSTGVGNVTLGDDSVFLYSNGRAVLTNNRNITSSSERLIGFYIKGNSTAKGDFTNNATIDFSNSKGSMGIYAPGGKATNKGTILVGKTDDIDPTTNKAFTDTSKITYGIGMAADSGGHIINDVGGVIRVYEEKSIGMYGKGAGTTVTNNGTIFLDGSRATDTNKIQNMTGVYVDEGATFINNGLIRTADAYAGKNASGKYVVNENVTGLTGVAVMNGSTLINNGKIHIDAESSSGVVIRGKVDSNGNVVKYAVIKNYGEIKVRGKGTTGVSYKDISPEDLRQLEALVNSKLISDPQGQELGGVAGTSKSYEGVTITVKDGKPIFSRGGRAVSESEVERITEIIGQATSNVGLSDIGFYVDTLGKTKPIDIDGTVPPINSQLIIGTEYSTLTNKKQWYVTDNAIRPFLDKIQGRNFKLTSLAGSLTWIATPVLDNYGQMKGVAMSKLPYTSFVDKSENAWNFADGLEQRYDKNALDSREKQLFNLLNGIGKNEQAILVQAYDEMMGHQYANVQQRVNTTGVILDKEFKNLKAEGNVSKNSNKIKTFGTKGEYSTDTAGVIDYKYNAYGVAYVHENEDIKLGRGTGWYTGIVHNTFKFKDIGNSKEEQLQTKVGLIKSVPFDDNNSLNWTISGDIFAGYNKMHRKFLVVNEIFNAKAKYQIYGVGIKNELNKEFRLSEDFSVRTYGSLKLEYARISKIKEKTGEVKLEVKENDYISIKPELGTELAYKHYFGTKTLKTSLGLAYENELGRIADSKNKGRVAGTNADWFNIRGEKEDRRGNVKVDLNVGLDNQRVGVVGNVGYDTKGSAVRGGVGLRVIF